MSYILQSNKKTLNGSLASQIADLLPTHSLRNLCPVQCDQIGRFLEVLGNKFAHKSSTKRLVTIWAIFENSFWNSWTKFLLKYLVTLVLYSLPCFGPIKQHTIVLKHSINDLKHFGVALASVVRGPSGGLAEAVSVGQRHDQDDLDQAEVKEQLPFADSLHEIWSPFLKTILGPSMLWWICNVGWGRSVTRWLDYLFNFWSLSTYESFAQLQNLLLNTKKCQRLLNICQSGKISPNLVTLVEAENSKSTLWRKCFLPNVCFILHTQKYHTYR